MDTNATRAVPVSELTIAETDPSPLGPWGALFVEHMREHRPTTYAELEREGRLTEAALEAETNAHEAHEAISASLRERGYTPEQAAETAKEIALSDWILLPSELDVPVLGETPKPA